MHSNVPGRGPTLEPLAADISAVGRIGAVPTLLKVLCDTTGMGFAAVARVTDDTWVACAVEDRIGFGLVVGGELELNSTLCVESRAARQPIVIDQASVDPTYAMHHTPRRYDIESYASFPIMLGNGEYFGNLCAIDPKPAQVSDPRVVSMFQRFADLIADQLAAGRVREREQAALLDERASSELREQFIAVLGHDLRNPLQAVYATGELLERKITDPKLAGMASRIKVNVRRMSALIDDVLDFARGRLGGGVGLTLREEPHLDTALAAVAKELQVAQPERVIKTHLHIDQPVWCDMTRIQQVASNLLGNALTHGSAATAVELTARTTATELVIEVWNDGEPIPAANIGRIFEPFWRQSTTGSRQGLGLGLYISAQILRAHAGTLGVHSDAASGTRFTARLPRIPPTGVAPVATAPR